MLVLNKFTDVQLSNCQTRAEHHGEALVPAIDLTVIWQTNNRALDMLSADAREAFYTKLQQREQPEKGQQEVDLPVDELPNLRFPKLRYPLKFDNEQIGMHCEVDYGLGGKSNIHLSLCKVKNFQITPVEGGTAEWKFTISSAADLTEKTIGVLSMQQQHQISIKLLPPKPGSEGERLAQEHAQKLAEDEGGLGDGDGDKEAWPFPEGDPRNSGPTAGDLFAAEHGTPAQKAKAAKAAGKTPAAKKAPAKKAAAKKKPPAKKAAAKKAKAPKE
jgi:hypothetical protein